MMLPVWLDCSSSLSTLGAVSTPVAAAVMAAPPTEFFMPKPADPSAIEAPAGYPSSGVPPAAPNTPVTVREEDMSSLMVKRGPTAAAVTEVSHARHVPKAAALQEVAADAVAAVRNAVPEVVEIPTMTQLVVPAVTSAVMAKPTATGAERTMPAAAGAVVGAAEAVVIQAAPEPSGPVTTMPARLDITPAPAPEALTSSGRSATTSGSLGSSLGGAVVVEVHSTAQKSDGVAAPDAKSQQQEEPSSRALVTAVPVPQATKSAPSLPAPVRVSQPAMQKVPRKPLLCSCFAPRVNV